MNSFIWKNPANAGGNISQLEQEVQQLQTQLQQIAAQIQTLTQQLANKAGKAEANTFTQKQKITTPNQALTLVQDNNATYVSFEGSTGDRRGYVGMGSSNSHKMHLNGKDGVQISSNAGDLELNPAGSINANNKPIINVGQSNEATAALSLSALSGKIRYDHLGRVPINGDRTIINLRYNVSKFFSLLIVDEQTHSIQYTSKVGLINYNANNNSKQVEIIFTTRITGQINLTIWYLEA